jgi:peptidoglycan/xylan/chitin deacetylase (PgdA/CDA1 family)
MKHLFEKAQNKLKYFLQPKAIVLSYHRIADVAIDPWQLAVSPANFEQQLQVLKKYRLFTAGELVDQLNNGTLKNGMVCITFDDGYRDNYVIAKPLLHRYKSPSTIFIPFHYVDQKRQFWWNELQTIVLGRHELPPNLSILINEEQFHFNLETDSKFDKVQWQKQSSWVWYEEPPSKRCKLYLELWKRLQTLDHEVIISILNELRSWSSLSIVADELDCPVSVGELGHLIHDPLFEIGIHTNTHPALAYLNKQKQYEEIETCKRKLFDLGNHKTESIAYPYGIYNNATISVCKELGLNGGFTTTDKPVLANDHSLELGRFHVKNLNGKEFEKQLNYWIKGYNF